MVPPPSLQNTPHSFAQSGCQFDLVFVYALVSKILFVGNWEAQKASWIRILFERRYKWESTVSQDKPRVDSGPAKFLYTNIVLQIQKQLKWHCQSESKSRISKKCKKQLISPLFFKKCFSWKIAKIAKAALHKYKSGRLCRSYFYCLSWVSPRAGPPCLSCLFCMSCHCDISLEVPAWKDAISLHRVIFQMSPQMQVTMIIFFQYLSFKLDIFRSCSPCILCDTSQTTSVGGYT